MFRLLLTGLLLLCFMLITGCAQQPNIQKAQVTKPNIVLLISDDQSWNHYSFMGHQTINTPNIDALAAKGVTFRRGYVPTGLCRPSLMTLATGHYASTHGVFGNDPADSKNPEKRAEIIAQLDKFDTLPSLLAKEGYLSHQSGKWWEGSYQNGGFSHGMTRGFPKPNGRHGDDGLKIGRKGMKPIENFIDLAVKEEKPFFIWYAPFLPHTPHNPPKRLFNKYMQEGMSAHTARYYAMVDWFDETNGQLMAYIEQKGLTDDTLFIYVTDNGWMQDPDSKTFAARSKQSAYEGGVRTPIIYAWGDKLKNIDRPELATSLDIFPTVLAAAGAKIPADLPGLNLLPQLKSGNKINRDRIFGESFAHDVIDVNNPEKTLLYRWVIEGQWKLLLTYDGIVTRYGKAHPRKEKRPQLFNLIADPHETDNLASKHPKIVASMVKHIDDWYPVQRAKTITKWHE